MMETKPFEGIRILEVGTRIATGTCGRLLADLGADVIVVEPRHATNSGRNKWVDRVSAVAGKSSILVDVHNPSDVEDISLLARHCDAVILSSDTDQNDAPSQWVEAFSKVPIACDITAFGSTGPLTGVIAHEWDIQAMTGIMETTGLSDAEPTPIGFPAIEMSAGIYAATGIALALTEYLKAGKGERIEIALYDVAINTLTTYVAAHYAGAEPGRLGNGHGMAVPWNAYQTRDGWILICTTNDIQWNKLVKLIGPQAQEARFAEIEQRLSLRQQVDRIVNVWTSQHTLSELETLLTNAGLPFGRISQVAELQADPNIRHRGSIQSVFDSTTGKNVKVTAPTYRFWGKNAPRIDIPEPDSVRRNQDFWRCRARISLENSTSSPVRKGIEGIRIIEVGQLTTAPLAARHLAMFGADVIKIEPPGGESARRWAPIRNGKSHFFVASNGEKRSVELDLRESRDQTYLEHLIKGADVLIENMKPGALKKMGFDAERIEALNPRLIYCAISGFGADSVYPGKPAVDTVVQAMSGMMDVTRSNGIPVKSGISIADIVGGQTGLLLVIAALLGRERTGRGCAIDISMQDVGASMTQHNWNRKALHVEAPKQVLSIGQACEAAQTKARELIQVHKDPSGQAWEIIASPLKMSHLKPRIGTLVGDVNKDRITWFDQ